MKKILRYLRNLVSVVKYLRLQGVLTALASDAAYAQLIRPLGQRPLILSGHPGDEVMALGGTMAGYLKRGIPLKVLTFTAGRHGTNTGRLSKPLGPRRKKEQLAAFAILGDPIALVSWDLDEKFLVDEALVQRLLEQVDEYNPDIIYAPSLLDSHPDSQSINRALIAVLQQLPSPRLKGILVAQYELWTPMVPNKILNINDFEDLKKKAIECHESQLLCRDYLGAMVGLNRYRAAMLGAGTSAEAFYVTSAQQYSLLGGQTTAPVIEMV